MTITNLQTDALKKMYKDILLKEDELKIFQRANSKEMYYVVGYKECFDSVLKILGIDTNVIYNLKSERVDIG